jgi:NADPH2:quinone reductase
VLAALYRSAGPSSVLAVEQVDPPPLGPGEVRVRMRVAAVNPTDYKSRLRTVTKPFQVPGQDGAGEVVEVGPGVDPARVGERVWVWFAAARGRRWGTAAQQTVVPARQAVALPDSASDDLAAGLGIPAMTAWHCLFADGPLAGRTVLVAGGAGAVGSAAVALARRAGARVIATASAAKLEQAQAYGAHGVLDRTAPDLAARVRAAAPEGVDRVVELALGANLAVDLAVLKSRSTVSTYADDPVPDLPVRDLMVANARLAFVLVYGLSDGELDAAVEGVTAAVADGSLRGQPPVRFPLEQIARAHDMVEGGAPGKVLIDVP